MSTAIEREFMDRFAKDGLGLNIGCGKTVLGNSIGLDIDPEAPAAMIVADAARLPIKDGALDYILAMASLEHIPTSPLLVLREWRRALKLGGVIAISVPDGDYGPEWALTSTKDDHYHAFTARTLRMYLDAAGFEVKTCESVSREPHRPEPIILAMGKKLAQSKIQRRTG